VTKQRRLAEDALMLTLGHDLKSQEPVTLDASHSRVLLICGKRGSGKTTALDAALAEINTLEQKIITAEDP